jgi:hypothetical protein
MTARTRLVLGLAFMLFCPAPALAPPAPKPKPKPLLQQLPNDRLGGRVPGQRVQVALDDDGGRSFVHGPGHRRTKRR